MTTSATNADLVLGAMRHQRDLFTGSSLGIPDVNTHVGSVIHAFETMAIERNLQQATDNLVRQKTQPGPSSTGSGSGGKKIILPPTSSGKSHLKSGSVHYHPEIIHDPVYGHIPQQFHEYYIEKSVDDTTVTTESSSNLDGASYIIDDNYRKSGFGAKPTNPIACQTNNNSRIPTMIMSKKSESNKQNNNNNNYEIVKNITVQSNTSHNNNSNNVKSYVRPKILQTTTDSIHFNINKDRKQQINQSAAVEEQFENYEQDFIRGSTVSQSFIKNVKGSGNRKTTHEKNVYQVTKNPVDNINRHASATPNRRSMSRNERKLKAKSMGVDELSERYTRHTGDGSSGSRTRARSNERRKTTYAPNSLDRAEL